MKCPSTNVDPLTPIVINAVEHHGLVTHACDKPKDHGGGQCQCACGKTWVTNVK